MMTAILLLTMLITCGAQHATGVFLETPASLNVTGGTVAEFTCTSSAVAFSLGWFVNGSVVHDPVIRDQGIISDKLPQENGVGIILTIPTKNATSNATIECVATIILENGTHFLNRSSALLMVQGPFEKVTNLTNESVNGTLHLSWTPLTTIDLTNIEHDLLYNVTITKRVMFDVVDERDTTIIVCKECPLLTPQYNFTLDSNETNTCVDYQFTVFAFNDDGRGDPATPIVYRGDTTVAPRRDITHFNVVSAEMEKDEFYVITSSFGVESPTEQPCCYTFTFTLDDNRINEVFTGFPVEDGINVTLGNSTSLPFNHIYTVNITAHNVAGTTNYTGNFSLSTYDLQEAFINNCSSSGTINITGVFVKNSMARGYFVVDINENGDPEHFMAFIDEIKDANQIRTQIANVSEGIHQIIMFDIEADGFPGVTAAINSSVRVSNGVEVPVMNASDYSITEEDGLVCVPCTTPLTDCVIVAYSPSNPMNLTLPENHSKERSCFNLADGNYYFATFDNVTGINSAVIFYSVQSPPTTTKPPPDISTNTNNIVAVLIPVVVIVVMLVTLMSFLGVCVWKMRQRNSHKKESLPYSEESHSVENTLLHRRAQVNIIEGDQPENPYITTGTDDTNMLSQLPSPENNSSEIHVRSANMPLPSNVRDGELEDQTQDLEPVSDWIHFPPPSYDAATSEFGHTITSSPLINLEPINETNGTDSENITETGETDIESMYATPTAATSTKAEPMYANTCVGNTNQEVAYATPELPKSTSKKPFLPKDTEVQYSEIQPCTEEGAISLPGCVVTEHGEMTRSVPEKSAIVSSSAIFFKPAAIMSVGTANAASTTEPTDAITATASITATKPEPDAKPELANATPELPKASKLAKETEVQHSSMMLPCTEEGTGGPQCLVMESSEVVTSTADDRKGYGTSMDVEGFNISTFSSHADDDSAYRNQRSDFRRESSPSSTSLLVVGSVSDQPPLQASSCGCWQMQKQLLPELQTRMRELNDMTTGSLVISALEKVCREERGDVKNISVQRQPSSDFNSLPHTLDSPLFTNQMQPSALPPSSGPCFHLPPPCGPCIYLPPSSGPRFLLPPSCAPHFLLPDCLGYGKTFPSITAVRKQGGRKTSKSQQRDAQMFMFLKGFMMKMLLHDVIRL